jgi:hypothetical protein
MNFSVMERHVAFIVFLIVDCCNLLIHKRAFCIVYLLKEEEDGASLTCAFAKRMKFISTGREHRVKSFSGEL